MRTWMMIGAFIVHNARSSESVPDQSSFPTRQYAYGPGAQALFAAADHAPLAAGGVYRFRLGKDSTPEALSQDAIRAELHDPFAQLVLSVAEPMPVTLKSLLLALDGHNAEADGLPVQSSFVA